MNTANNDTAIVTFEIQVNGTAIPDSTEVVSIHIENNLNEVPTARIVISDGNASTEQFPVSSSGLFEFGSDIEIKVGYNTNNTQVFTGIITGQAININQRASSSIEVQCHCPVVKMTEAERDVVFRKWQLADIIKNIVGNYAALSVAVTDADAEILEISQGNHNDWDFLIGLAAAYDLIVMVNGAEITVKKAVVNSSPDLELVYGQNIYALSAEMNSGNKSAYGDGNKFSSIQGTIKIAGTDVVKPNSSVALRGLGSKFSGNQYVSGVTHVIATGEWHSMITIGIADGWFPLASF